MLCFVQSLPWLFNRTLLTEMKYLFIAILCAEMSRVNWALIVHTTFVGLPTICISAENRQCRQFNIEHSPICDGPSAQGSSLPGFERGQKTAISCPQLAQVDSLFYGRLQN